MEAGSKNIALPGQPRKADLDKLSVYRWFIVFCCLSSNILHSALLLISRRISTFLIFSIFIYTTALSAASFNPFLLLPSPAVTYTKTDVQVYGERTGAIDITDSGAVGSVSYLWNDGNTNKDRTGLAAGTYSVTVTDNSGCTHTQSGIPINQPSAALALSETHVNILCNGGSTGSIDLSVTGGTGPYSYAWVGTGGYTNNVDQDIANRPAGAYNVTVTDAGGCTASLSVTLTQPAALSLSTAITNPTCPPSASPPVNSDGAINHTVAGGTGPYAYACTASGGGIVPGGQANSQNLTLLVAGTYTVVVTDNNSCAATTPVTLVNLNPVPTAPNGINH